MSMQYQSNHQRLLSQKSLWLAAAICACAAPTQAVAKDGPAGLSTIAGIKESLVPIVRHPTARMTQAVDDRREYLAEQAKLDEALSACSKAPKRCPPGIKAYQALIDDSKKFSGNALLQAAMVNAGVNLSITYDEKELKGLRKPNGWYRTLKNTLVDQKGVCNEHAELKYYALRKAGIPSGDILILNELVVEKGRLLRIGHNVVALRTGGKTWILDDQQDWGKSRKINAHKAVQMLDDHSEIEKASVHVNFDGQSAFSEKDDKFYPWLSYNENHVGYFPAVSESNKPVAGRLSRVPAPRQKSASLLDLTHNNRDLQRKVAQAIIPVLQLHFKISEKPISPAHAAKRVPELHR
jgi:predicted transglutaminase-like cysteine proteinase